jgi:hypothetical protein
LTIKTDKEVYHVGDEIQLDYVIENIGQESVKFYSQNRYNLNFTVTPDEGKRFEEEPIE